MGLAELVNTYLFPVPDEVIQAFGESLNAPSLPLWQLVFFLAILPGVCEEIAFRGVLLYGLRKRMGPWATAITVGVIFGFFHVALFRIIPTAWLGVLLAGVVLLSGSILPAILWHALNNALALVPSELGWLPPDFEVPGWGVALAGVGLTVSFWILWVTRRPRGRSRRKARGSDEEPRAA